MDTGSLTCAQIWVRAVHTKGSQAQGGGSGTEINDTQSKATGRTCNRFCWCAQPKRHRQAPNRNTHPLNYDYYDIIVISRLSPCFSCLLKRDSHAYQSMPATDEREKGGRGAWGRGGGVQFQEMLKGSLSIALPEHPFLANYKIYTQSSPVCT